MSRVTSHGFGVAGAAPMKAVPDAIVERARERPVTHAESVSARAAANPSVPRTHTRDFAKQLRALKLSLSGPAVAMPQLPPQPPQPQLQLTPAELLAIPLAGEGDGEPAADGAGVAAATGPAAAAGPTATAGTTATATTATVAAAAAVATPATAATVATPATAATAAPTGAAAPAASVATDPDGGADPVAARRAPDAPQGDAPLTPLEQAVHELLGGYSAKSSSSDSDDPTQSSDDPTAAHAAIDALAAATAAAATQAQPAAPAQPAPSAGAPALHHAAPTAPVQIAEQLATSASHVHLVVDDGGQRVVMTVAMRGNEVNVALRTSDDHTAAALARNAASLDDALRGRGLTLGQLASEHDRGQHREHDPRDAYGADRERPDPQPSEPFELEEFV